MSDRKLFDQMIRKKIKQKDNMVDVSSDSDSVEVIVKNQQPKPRVYGLDNYLAKKAQKNSIFQNRIKAGSNDLLQKDKETINKPSGNFILQILEQAQKKPPPKVQQSQSISAKQQFQQEIRRRRKEIQQNISRTALQQRMRKQRQALEQQQRYDRQLRKQKRLEQYQMHYQRNRQREEKQSTINYAERKTRLQQESQKKKQKKKQQKLRAKQRQRQLQLQRIEKQKRTVNNFLGSIINAKIATQKQETGLKNLQMLEQLQKKSQSDSDFPIQTDNYQQKKKMKKRNLDPVQIAKQMKRNNAQALIKLLLSHEYQKSLNLAQNKKIPNIFKDRFVYTKTFQYLLGNESIADIETRLKKAEGTISEYIRSEIVSFKRNSEDYIQLILKQIPKKDLDVPQKQLFMLKNFTLSRNRLGIITNTPHFKLKHYGVPSRKDKQRFAFLCFLCTPQSKQQLNSQIKVLARFKQYQLDSIIAETKSRQVYFIDFQKISTLMRDFVAVSNIHLSDLSPFIYNPTLLERHQSQLAQNRQLLDPILNVLSKQYNPIQFQSIREMVYRQYGIILLQGPPGTGKTSTLLGLLSAQYQYLKLSGDTRKILICAPSNAAINHITKRILTQGLYSGTQGRVKPRILRTGIVQTDDQDIRSVSLDDQCEKKAAQAKSQSEKKYNMSTPQIKQKVISLQKQIKKIIEEKNQKKNYEQAQSKIKQLQQQIRNYESVLYQFRRQKVQQKAFYNNLQKQLIDNAEIILTTLSSSGTDKMDSIRGNIGCLIVDQAAQATEPNLLVALQTGVQKVLLIGDPYQLPATTMSPDSSSTLFNRSLFERILDSGLKPYFLNIQYRMASQIRRFPSQRFYQNRLQDGANISTRPHPQVLNPFQGRSAIFIDLQCGQEYFSDNSYSNESEAILVTKLIEKFQNSKLQIGIITPYQSQRKVILKFIRRMKKNASKRKQQKTIKSPQQNQTENIIQKKGEKDEGQIDQTENSLMINTVDSFQGQQKDIIIISTVRSNQKGSIGFLIDQRRVNVALTRAKYLMIVIGNANTLGSNETWNGFMEYIQKQKSYYAVSEQDRIDQTIKQVFKGEYLLAPQRIRYQADKLTKDPRKYQRYEIKADDFVYSRKKRQKNKEKKQIENRQTITIQDQSPIKRHSKVEDQQGFNNKKKIKHENDLQFLQKKKNKLEQGIQIEQMNKNLLQIQKKIKSGAGGEYEFLKGLF